VVVPHESTIRRVLQDLDPGAVEAAMRTWALAQLADQSAPDGPATTAAPGFSRWTARPCAVPTSPAPTSTTYSSSDAVTSGYRQPHLVSVLDQGSGVVLGQVEVKGSEVAAFTTLLDELDLTDVLVTATRVCRAATSTTCPPTGSAP
jgi:hypothetical protein